MNDPEDMNVVNTSKQSQNDSDDLSTDPNFWSESIASASSQGDLYVSKESSELLASRLKEKKM